MKRSTPLTASTEYIDPLNFPQRRARHRHQPQSLVYIELDEGNGGIALNIGEDGLAVQAVMALIDDFLPRLRFRLPNAKEWIQTSAQVVWANENRKLLGLRFVDLPEESRQLIRDWFEREKAVGSAPEAAEMLPESLEGRAAPLIPTMVMPPPPFSNAAPVENTEPEPAIAREAELEPTLYPENNRVETPAMAAPVAAAAEEKSAHAFSFQRDGFGASSPDGSLPNRWSVAVFFLFLATASLAAGWAVGRGALAGALGSVSKVFSREGAAGGSVPVVSTTSVPQQRPSEIEIVNSDNVRWTIPLDASVSTSAAVPVRPASGDTFSNRFKKTQGFRTWVLTAPLQAKAGTPESSEPVAAPAVNSPAEVPANGVSLAAQPIAIPAPPPPRQSLVRPAQLIRRVDPEYPVLALPSRVQGTVKLHITVSASGTVRDVHVISAPPLLADAAVKAASKWLYSPMLMDGKPTESGIDISMTFHLPQ